MQTLLTTMIAVCLLAVPYVCLRLGAARRSWVLPAALIVVSALATPAAMLTGSYLRWRETHRKFVTEPTPVRVAGEGRELPTVVRDGVAEVTLPDGRVLRLTPPEWAPSSDVRVDQSLVLAGAAAGLGGLGYAGGRLVRRAGSRRAGVLKR